MGTQNIIVNKNRIRLSTDKLRALQMRTDKLTYPEIGYRMECSEMAAFNRVQRAIEIIITARDNEMRLCK